MESDQQLTISVHDNLESLEALRPEWDALVAEYPVSTIFSTYEWLVPWWRAFGDADTLVVLAFRNAASELVGLAPMALTVRPAFRFSVRVLRLMGDGSHDSDNLDLPVRTHYQQTFCRSLLGWLVQQHARVWDVCELNALPSDSPSGAMLSDAVDKLHWMSFRSTRPQTVVELAANWEAHLKRISSKERGKIGLRARKLEKQYEVRIRQCSQESELEPMLQALVELHTKHWRLRGLPGTLHSPARRQFYREMSKMLLARRRLEFWVLELNGSIVAAQLGLRHGTTVFSLQEGFDPEYSADSVGYVLRSQVLKQLISDGVRRYDFLGGANESKIRWGGELRNYVNFHFALPFSRGSVYLAFKHRTRQGKEWLRTHTPPRVWSGLKSAVGKNPNLHPSFSARIEVVTKP